MKKGAPCLGPTLSGVPGSPDRMMRDRSKTRFTTGPKTAELRSRAIDVERPTENASVLIGQRKGH